MNDMSRAPEASAAAPMRAWTGAAMMLAFACAVIVTTEFIAVGLLPVMARDLDISIAAAGWLVTWFALSSAILGPPLTMIAGKFEPRRVVAVVLLAFGAGNLFAALVPSYEVVVAVRLVQGAALPVLVSIGSAAVADLAGPGRKGKAVAIVNVGVVVGIVFGVPAGVALADASAWPTTFLGLAALSLVATVLIAATFPDIGNGGLASAKAQAAILFRPAFQFHLLLSAVLFAAMFAAYTYLAAFLEAAAGFGGRGIALTLMGFGIAGLVGNWIAGRVVDRGPTTATAGAALILTVATAAVSVAGTELALLLPLLALWGGAHTASFVLCQVRVMYAGSAAPAFAASLNISACNLGIAGGAVAGGWVVERHDVGSIGLASAALGVAALGLAAVVRGLEASRPALARPG